MISQESMLNVSNKVILKDSNMTYADAVVLSLIAFFW